VLSREGGSGDRRPREARRSPVAGLAREGAERRVCVGRAHLGRSWSVGSPAATAALGIGRNRASGSGGGGEPGPRVKAAPIVATALEAVAGKQTSGERTDVGERTHHNATGAPELAVSGAQRPRALCGLVHRQCFRRRAAPQRCGRLARRCSAGMGDCGSAPGSGSVGRVPGWRQWSTLGRCRARLRFTLAGGCVVGGRSRRLRCRSGRGCPLGCSGCRRRSFLFGLAMS